MMLQNSIPPKPISARFIPFISQSLYIYLNGFHEGGWFSSPAKGRLLPSFNTQPPEGGWAAIPPKNKNDSRVSTHSRPKAAGFAVCPDNGKIISFNTQPPEGGWDLGLRFNGIDTVFQHTAARRRLASSRDIRRSDNCFNTQPPEGGW